MNECIVQSQNVFKTCRSWLGLDFAMWEIFRMRWLCLYCMINICLVENVLSTFKVERFINNTLMEPASTNWSISLSVDTFTNPRSCNSKQACEKLSGNCTSPHHCCRCRCSSTNGKYSLFSLARGCLNATETHAQLERIGMDFCQ